MTRLAEGTLATNCLRCARRVTAVATQWIDEAWLRWSLSSPCAHCEHTEASDGRGLPPDSIRQALMDARHAIVRMTPTTLAEALAARRIGPLLDCDGDTAAGIATSMFGPGFICTTVEANHLRNALRPPFRPVVTEHEGAPTLAEWHSFPTAPIEHYAHLWTTERTAWVIARVGRRGLILLDREHNRVKIIEDPETSVEVISRMAENGVPIVDVDMKKNDD